MTYFTEFYGFMVETRPRRRTPCRQPGWLKSTTNRAGFSISRTGVPLTPAEVNSGEFVVEDASEEVGVKVDLTLANGETVSFPIAPIVTIYR